MRRHIVISWHRFYDPDTGRYITADPVGLLGGINLYAYTFNNPVNWIDPWGLSAAGDFTGAIVTAGQKAAQNAGVAAAGPVGLGATILVTLADGTQIGRESLSCSLLTSDIEGDEKHCFYDCGEAGWTIMTISKCDSCPDYQRFEDGTLDPTLFSGQINLIGNPIK